MDRKLDDRQSYPRNSREEENFLEQKFYNPEKERRRNRRQRKQRERDDY